MQTITLPLPDNVNLRDARTFLLEKMYEAGFLPSDQTAQTLDEPDDEDVEVDPDPDSWFTLEERKQFRRNRKRLDEEAAKNPPKISHEEYHQLLLNGPVADEEEIQALEEIQEMRKQWTLP